MIILCCVLLFVFFFFLFLIFFFFFFFFFQAEDGIRDGTVTGVQTCAPPISGFRHRWPNTNSPTAMMRWTGDRKSTRLNSSHSSISYAVFCLKKKKNPPTEQREVKPSCTWLVAGDCQGSPSQSGLQQHRRTTP